MMQLIKGAVGEGAANAVSDVALVQAILVKTQRPAAPARAATPGHPAALPRPAGPYLASYDGVFGPGTAGAILAFQHDQALVLPGGEAGPGFQATPGTVTLGDPTWLSLTGAIPRPFANLRVLDNHKTVYIEATVDQLNAKLALATNLTFNPQFRLKVNSVINHMFTNHGIAIGIAPQGDRRTFQTQYDLVTSGRGVTRAGPGESNHNFGMAADFGFVGLRWLRPNGDVVENEDYWLRQLDPQQQAGPEALGFWDALRAIGTLVGTFRGPLADRPHLQNWDDSGVSVSARLADLLSRSGTMHWSAAHGVYQSDLGFGGELVPVGSAVQIWNREARVTADVIERLRAAAAARLARARGAHPPGAHPPPPPPVGGGPAPVVAPRPPGPNPERVVLDMQNALRHQFDLADANWQAWTPR